VALSVIIISPGFFSLSILCFMKTRNRKKSEAKSATNRQEHLRETKTIRKTRRVAVRNIVKPEASVVKQEDCISETLIFQPVEALVVVKQEDSADEKWLSFNTTTTEQGKIKAGIFLFFMILTFYMVGPSVVDSTASGYPPKAPDGTRIVDKIKNVTSVYCTICKKSFSTKYYYHSHMKKFHIDNSTLLPSKPSKSNLLPVVSDPNYYCRACNHRFASKYTYRKHLRTVHGMDLLPLKSQRVPSSNILPVIDDPNNSCRSCNRVFRNNYNYIMHLMTSHDLKVEPFEVPKPKILPIIDDPNYYCRSCKHQFATKYSYKVHLIAVHQLKLDVSQRAQKLNRNNLVPLVDDPNHYCQACNHRFVNQQGYRKHLMLAHSITPKPARPVPNPNILPVIDDLNYYCRSCKHQFISKYTYGSHLVNVHKMKVKP
jgi:hypothetical protein